MLTARKVQSVKDGTYSDEVHTFLGPPTDSSPIIGNTFSHRRTSWLARGSNLVFVENVSSRIIAYVDLSDFVHDSCTITCGVELNYPDSQYPLLLLGCATALGGMLIVYDPFRRRGYRALDLDIEITCLCVINCNSKKLSVLPSLLKGMNGIVVAGGIDGAIIVIDLCLHLIDKAIKGEFDRGEESWVWPKTTSRGQYVNYDDNEYTISCKKLLCTKNNESLCFVLNDVKGKVQAPQQNGNNSPVSSLHYNPNTVSLFAGFEVGVWHMYNMISLTCVFISSTETGTGVSVVSMSSLEPSDDPRATIYLWVCHSSPPNRPAPILWPGRSPPQSPVRTRPMSSSDDPPFSIMYALIFREKTFLPSYGVFYSEFLQCSISHEIEMTKDFSNFLSGRLISVDSIVTSFRNSYLCKERGEESEELALWSIAWECGDESVDTYLTIFDLNQWYKDQMPSEPKSVVNGIGSDVPLKDTGYFTTIRLPNPSRQTTIAVSVDPHSIDAFRALYPIDAHYYPSALSFGCMCIGTEGVSFKSVLGIQEWAIKMLSQNGPIAMSQPIQAVQGCLSVALLPLFDDVNTTFNSTMSPDACRSFIVTVCVENGISEAILDCARHWFETMGSDESCSVSFLVNTLWDIHVLYKSKFDTLSVTLFDHSGVEFDFTSRTTLQFCYLMMKQVCDIFLRMQNEFSFEITSCDIKNKVEAIHLILMYANLVQWCLNIRMLPEKNSMNLPETAIPYHYDLLRTDTEHRRKTNSLMIDAVIEHFIPDAKVMWGRLYPPSSVQALVRIALIPGVDEIVKHLIIHYFLLDIVHTIPHEKYSDSIEEILKYHYYFHLSESASRRIQAYWDIDRANFQDGVDGLLDLSVKRTDMADWEHRLILDILLKNKEYSNAFNYMKGKRPPLNTVSDMKLEVTLTVAVGNIANALFLTRQRTSIRDSLREHFFSECLNFSRMKALYHLPLDEHEEKSFLEFLGRSKDPVSQDSVLYFYISRKRFTEAFVHYDKMKISGICCNDTKSRNRDLIIQGLKKSLGPVAVYDRYAWDAKHTKPPPEFNGEWKPTSAYLKFDTSNPKKPRLLTSPKEFTAIACWQAQKIMSMHPTTKPIKPRDEDVLSTTIIPEIATAAVRAAAKRKREAQVQDMHTPTKRPRELLTSAVQTPSAKEVAASPSNRLNYSIVKEMVSTPVVTQKRTPSHKTPPSRPASILKSRSVKRDEVAVEEAWTDSTPKKITFSLPVEGGKQVRTISKKKLFAFKSSPQKSNDDSTEPETDNEMEVSLNEKHTTQKDSSHEDNSIISVESRLIDSQSETSGASFIGTEINDEKDESQVYEESHLQLQKSKTSLQSEVQIQPDNVVLDTLLEPSITSPSEPLSKSVVDLDQSVESVELSEPSKEAVDDSVEQSTSVPVAKEDTKECLTSDHSIMKSDSLPEPNSSLANVKKGDPDDTKSRDDTHSVESAEPELPMMPIIKVVESIAGISHEDFLDDAEDADHVKSDDSSASNEESYDGLYDNMEIRSSENESGEDECLADQAEGEPDVEPPRLSSSVNLRRENVPSNMNARREVAPNNSNVRPASNVRIDNVTSRISTARADPVPAADSDDVVFIQSDSEDNGTSQESPEYSRQGSPPYQEPYSDDDSDEDESLGSYEPDSPSSDSLASDQEMDRRHVNGANAPENDDAEISCETIISQEQDHTVESADDTSRIASETAPSAQLEAETRSDTEAPEEDSHKIQDANLASGNISISEVFEEADSSEGDMTGIVEDSDNEVPVDVSLAPENVEIVEVEMDSDMDSFNVTGNVNILDEADIVDQVIGHPEENDESSEESKVASESEPTESQADANKGESILFKSFTSTEFEDVQSDDSSNNENGNCSTKDGTYSESVQKEHSPVSSESESKEPVEVQQSQGKDEDSFCVDIVSDESSENIVTTDPTESLVEDTKSSSDSCEVCEEPDIINVEQMDDVESEAMNVDYSVAAPSPAEDTVPSIQTPEPELSETSLVVNQKETSQSSAAAEIHISDHQKATSSQESDKEKRIAAVQTSEPMLVEPCDPQNLKEANKSSTGESKPPPLAESSGLQNQKDASKSSTGESEPSDNQKASSEERQSVGKDQKSLNVCKPKLVDRSVLTDNDSLCKSVRGKSPFVDKQEGKHVKLVDRSVLTDKGGLDKTVIFHSVVKKEGKHVKLVDRSVLTDGGGLDKTVIFHSRTQKDRSPPSSEADEKDFPLLCIDESDLSEDNVTMDDSARSSNNTLLNNVDKSVTVALDNSVSVEPSKHEAINTGKDDTESDLQQSSQDISAVGVENRDPDDSVLPGLKPGNDQSTRDITVAHEAHDDKSIFYEEKVPLTEGSSKLRVSKEEISTLDDVQDTVIFKESKEPQKSLESVAKSGIDYDDGNQTLNTALFIDVDSDSQSSTALEIISVGRDSQVDDDDIMETGFLGDSVSNDGDINSDTSSLMETAFVMQSSDASHEKQSLSYRNQLVNTLLKSASKSRKSDFLDVTVGVASEVSQSLVKPSNITMVDKCIMTDKSYLVRYYRKMAKKRLEEAKQTVTNEPDNVEGIKKLPTHSSQSETPVKDAHTPSKTSGHIILTRSLTKKRQSIDRDLGDTSSKHPKPEMVDHSVLTDIGGFDETVIFHSRKPRAQSLQPESRQSEWKSSSGMGQKVKSHEQLSTESVSSQNSDIRSNTRVIRKLFRRTQVGADDSSSSNLNRHPISSKLVGSASVENLSDHSTTKNLRQRSSSSMDLSSFNEGSTSKGPSVPTKASDLELENLARLRREERKSRLSRFSNLHGIAEVPELESVSAKETPVEKVGQSSASNGRVIRVVKRRIPKAASDVEDVESEDIRGPPELEKPVAGRSDGRIIRVGKRRQSLAKNLGVKDIESEESRGPPELEEPVPVPKKRSRRRTTSSSSEPPSLEPEGEMDYKVTNRKQRASSHEPETKLTRPLARDLNVPKGKPKRHSRSLHENEEVQASPLPTGLVTPSKNAEDDQAYTPSDYSENRRLTRHQKLLIERSMAETRSPSTPQTPKRGRRTARSMTPELTPTRSSQRLLSRRADGKM